MNYSDEIKGGRLLALMGYLAEERVIFSLHLLGTEYERLTCVKALQQKDGRPWLLVDAPDGFRSVMPKSGPLRLRFNFNGPDRLEYIFTVQGGHLEGRELLLPFPDAVERVQRRKNFRMQTPAGTKMFLQTDKTRVVLGLINISLGGTCGVLIKHNRNYYPGSLLTTHQIIHRAGIKVPADSEAQERFILIRRLEVRRIEHDAGRKIYRFAFEFMEMDANEREKLTQAILHFQRMFLKRR